MRFFKDIPDPIIRHIFCVFIIGVGCLAVGISIYVAAGDKIMLLLSLALFIASMFKACNGLYIGIHKKYNTITGTCVTMKRQAFKGKNEVVLVDADYREFSLYLHIKYKLQEGKSYIFYFKNHSIGEQLDINLLGFEKEMSEHK